MNKIILNGKEYDLSDDLVAQIEAEVMTQEKEDNPFKRVDKHSYYYFITSDGHVSYDTEDKFITDNDRYNIGNYCRDKKLMEQWALHETLNRLLWRYSEEHGGDLPWGSALNDHYRIYYDYIHEAIITSYNDCHKQVGCIYFRDKETAQAAIEEVIKPFLMSHPEFVW